MHAFLVFCIASELVLIGLLIWNTRRQSIGQDSVNGRMDAVIAEAARLSESVAVNTQALFRLDQRHADLVKQVGIMNSETNDRLKATTDLIGRIDASLQLTIDGSRLAHQGIRERMAEGEAKVADLTEGCGKLDDDLSLIASDVRECVKLRQSDLAGLNERITEIADAQEKARRKSGLRGAPAAFESLRSVAESGAVKHPDPERSKLVALAEG